MLSNRCRQLLVLLVALVAMPGAAQAQPAEVLCARGVALYNQGNLTAARPLLRKAVDQDPTLTSAAHYLGLALIRQGSLRDGRKVLKAAAQRDGQDARLLTDLGLAYLAEGNRVWAVRTLTRARDLAPHDARIRHYLGTAMVDMGAAADAVPELQRAASAPHQQQQDSALQLGLALYRAKRWAESRRQLDTLLGTAHAPVARQLLRAAYEAEGTPAAWLSAQLTTGMVVDTNPLYLAENSDYAGIVVPGLAVGGRLTLRPWVSPRGILSADMAVSRVFYFGEYLPASNASTAAKATTPDPADASPTSLGAAVSYTRRLGGKHQWQLAAGYAFGLTWLDGAGLTDQSNLFMESHAGSLTLQWRMPHKIVNRLRYTLSREVYAQRPRNFWGNELSLEADRSFLDNRVRLLVWLSLRHEAADADHYAALVPGLGAGLSWLAPLDLVFGLRAAYEYANHMDSADSLWGKQREDHGLVFTAELGRALLWSLRARVVYQRFQNPSSVATFENSRDLLSLGLSWSYQ